MTQLGVGIIGFGFMGKAHTFAYRTIPLYYDPPPVNAQLKVVCRKRHSLAEQALQTGGFERFATDPEEVCRAEDVDIVHICTPNHLHFAPLKAAMEEGKHIYVDKPVTANLGEAQEIQKKLAGYKGIAQVALQYRFLPATLRAKQLVDEGFLGPVTHFRAVYLHSGNVDPKKPANWKSFAAAGGGVIRDLGSHIIDLLTHLIGPFESVLCCSRIWAAERPRLESPGETLRPGAEEAAVMLLKKADGSLGTVEASKIATGTEDELRFEIHGRYGAIRFNLMDPNYLEVFDGRLPEGDYGGRRGWQRIACVSRYPPPGGSFPAPKGSVGWLRAHVHSIYNFLCCIAGRTSPHPSLAEGIYLQRILEAVRESAEKESWVKLPSSVKG